jgi:hypothetical protein
MRNKMNTAVEIGSYRPEHDTTEEEYPWLVIDADGDVADAFATKREAIRDAQEREASDQEDRDTEEMDDLRQEISDLLDTCTELSELAWMRELRDQIKRRVS